MTDISPEAVKAFVSANADVIDPVQRRLLDMLTALVAKCESLEQERAVIWRQRRDVQGTNDVLQAANYTLLTERDAIKAKLARLCEAAEKIAIAVEDITFVEEDGRRFNSYKEYVDLAPMISGELDALHEVVTAARETLP